MSSSSSISSSSSSGQYLDSGELSAAAHPALQQLQQQHQLQQQQLLGSAAGSAADSAAAVSAAGSVAVGEAGDESFGGVPPEYILPVLHKVPPEDCVNGRTFWTSYDKNWDKLTVLQRNRTIAFFKASLKTEAIQERVKAEARQLIAQSATEHRGRQEITNKHDKARLLHLRKDPRALTKWTRALRPLTFFISCIHVPEDAQRDTGVINPTDTYSERKRKWAEERQRRRVRERQARVRAGGAGTEGGEQSGQSSACTSLSSPSSSEGTNRLANVIGAGIEQQNQITQRQAEHQMSLEERRMQIAAASAVAQFGTEEQKIEAMAIIARLMRGGNEQSTAAQESKD